MYYEKVVWLVYTSADSSGDADTGRPLAGSSQQFRASQLGTIVRPHTLDVIRVIMPCGPCVSVEVVAVAQGDAGDGRVRG